MTKHPAEELFPVVDEAGNEISSAREALPRREKYASSSCRSFSSFQ